MYHFYPQLLLRTPVYPHQAYGEKALAKFIKDPFFLAAIQLASPSLYLEVEKGGFEAGCLPARVIVALLKYLNRMCFRPTPFGLFSGFAVASWKAEPKGQLLLDSDQLKAHAALSFTRVLDLAEELAKDGGSSTEAYYTNRSLYKVEDEFRFLRFEEDRDKGGRNFYVDAVGFQPFLQCILQFCQEPKSRDVILDKLVEETGASPEEATAFVEQLVAQQLLVSTGQANITGEDYFHRLGGRWQDLPSENPIAQQLRTVWDKLDAIRQLQSANGIGAVLLEHAVAGKKPDRSPLYINLERQVKAGGVPVHLQKDILEGLTCVRRLLPVQQPSGLQRFQEAFIKKFDRRVVPLLVALDPELGVGYEELANSFLSPKLLQGIAFSSQAATTTPVEWSPVHALLLDKWRSVSGVPPVIRLYQEELERLPAADDTAALPPSTSLLFRVSEDKVYVEQAGGISATALIGRFTPLSPAVQAMAEDIARQEEEANPEVIFAEIAHISEEHTANIDRRCAVRKYEIPILVQSGVAAEFQIHLSDLMVQVEGEQVILWSHRLKKRVIPRLSSAFNYTRDDLAVFRFLCDLQYQGLQANFTLDLSQFFPDLDFYPRVEYKQTILALATWRLREAQLKGRFRYANTEQAAQLRQLAKELDWPRHVAITQHDHQLVFDLEKEEDVAFLLENLRNKSSVKVREFPFVEGAAPLVADEAQQPFVHQFLAALYHTQEVYKGITSPTAVYSKAMEKKRKLLPGSEWLYLKLYCHPSRSNQLLTQTLLPLLDRLRKRGGVKQWFFVRYREPDYHLRVRIQPGPHVGAGELLSSITKKLQKQVQKGIVQDVQVAVYERELERYGPEQIEAVETAFCASSELVARFLQKTPFTETDYGYYGIAFSTLDVMLTAFGLALREKVQVLHSLYEAFYREHGQTKALREQLSRKYREISQLKAILPDATLGSTFDNYPDLKKQLMAFLQAHQVWASQQKAMQYGKRVQLLNDLMHMHLNRLLVDLPRRQELVIYYCLWKHFQSLLARTKAEGQACSAIN